MPPYHEFSLSCGYCGCMIAYDSLRDPHNHVTTYTLPYWKGGVGGGGGLLPVAEFLASGGLRQTVQTNTINLAPMAVVRVVDKGPGQLWRFCRAWAWSQLQAKVEAKIPPERKQGFTCGVG